MKLRKIVALVHLPHMILGNKQGLTFCGDSDVHKFKKKKIFNTKQRQLIWTECWQQQVPLYLVTLQYYTRIMAINTQWTHFWVVQQISAMTWLSFSASA